MVPRTPHRLLRLRSAVSCALVAGGLALTGPSFAQESDAKEAETPAPADAEAAETPTEPGATEAVANGDKLSIPYKKVMLDNGLEVLLHHDARTPFVAVSVWYHVGAIDEPKGKTGFAHLFEHLMFQGSENVGKDNHIAYLEQAGASVRGGMVNGTTNEDRTNYFEVVPRNELDLALWLESDRMGWLMTSMTQDVLDEQRGVVKNERRQSVENRPYGLAEEQLWQTMFPKDHPYWGMVIGSMDDLDAASMEDVLFFYDTYYAPSNATLAISGDFDEDQVMAKVKKYFGVLPKWPKPKTPEVKAPAPLAEPLLVEVKEKLGRLPLISLKWFTPALYQEGDADLDILSHVLTGSKSARLTRSLVIEERAVQNVAAYQQSYGNVSVFTIEAQLNPGRDPQEVINLIQAQLEELQDLPPLDEEVQRARDSLETRVLFGLQKIGGFSGRAEKLQSYNHYLGEPDSLAFDVERYRKVTPDSIAKIVTSHLLPTQCATLIATPLTDEERAAAEAEAAAAAAAAAEAKAGDAKADDAKAEDAKAEDAKAEDAKTEDANADDPKAEDAKGGDQ